MPSLVDKVIAVSSALEAAAIPHALGGALALAWCTGQARGTIDIDVNVFVEPSRVDVVLAALPDEVRWTEDDVRVIRHDGQVRLWWDRTPVDLFFDTTPFHRDAATRAVRHEFLGHTLPFLACSDLAVFKAMFDRTKDWADLEAMVAVHSVDVDAVVEVLATYLGADDHRIARLRLIARQSG